MPQSKDAAPTKQENPLHLSKTDGHILLIEQLLQENPLHLSDSDTHILLTQDIVNQLLIDIGTIPRKPSPLEDLSNIQKLAFHILHAFHDDETLDKLKGLHRLHPGWINLKHDNYNDGRAAVMTAVNNGSFIFANFLLDLGADVTITDHKGRNILFSMSVSRYAVKYSDQKTIADDELKIFQRIYKMHDWSQKMDNDSKVSLMAALFLGKKDSLIDFLKKQKFFESLVQINIQKKNAIN